MRLLTADRMKTPGARRGAWALGLAVNLSVVTACIRSHTGELMGASHKTPLHPTPAAVDAGPPPAPPPRDGGIPRDFQTRFHKLNTARFVSRGHAGGVFMVDLWANAPAEDAYGKPLASMPVGSVLIKEHFTLDGGTDSVGPIMMMAKEPPGYDPSHGDWRYVIEGAQHAILADGRPSACVSCHEDAPADYVFRIPNPK